MIVAKKSEASEEEFSSLLSRTRGSILGVIGTKKPNPAELNSTTFENIVYEHACGSARGTIFENTIERKGLHAFPDIIAKKYFGIEVKTTTGNKWTSTGNSVLESTRTEGVERIYILFAKFGGGIDIKYRQYPQCLYDIAVTHSPRYLIDMNLPEGDSIFDKIGVEYDVLRKESNPITTVKNYYRKLLKDGEELWWMEQNEKDASVSPIIKPFKVLTRQQKERITTETWILFPEIFGVSNLKFERVATYFVTKHNVICANVRDIFTAGGRDEIIIKKKRIDVPQIYINLKAYAKQINEVINMLPKEQFLYYWKTNKLTDSPLEVWKKMIDKISLTTTDGISLNQKGLKLSDIFEEGLGEA